MAEASMSSASSSSSSSSSTSARGEISSPTPSRSRSTTPFEPAKELLAEYQNLLSSTFDLTGLLPTQPQEDDEDEGGKTMTKAEKQNAKKKRRKEREREAKLAEAGGGAVQSKPDTSVAFRLFSSCPIQSVKLEDEVVEYLCPPNPRHRDSTEEEKAIRRERAEASAVSMTGADLGGPSTLADRWSRISRTPRLLTTSTPSYDHQRLSILSINPDESGMTTPSNPSRPTSKAIPVIEVKTAQSSKRGVRRSRSKRKRSIERPLPGYWRPKGGLGGKSQSTIWGYGVGMPVKGR